MKNHLLVGMLIGPALCWTPVGSLGQAPRLLPFQGRLVDAQGHAVADGVKVIQFQVYGEPSGGDALWGGEVHRTTVNGGLVNVILGTKNSFAEQRAGRSGDSFWDQQLYLQISVDSNGDGQITAADPPLLPRQAIPAPQFAIESRTAAKLGGVSAGSILVNQAGSLGPRVKDTQLVQGQDLVQLLAQLTAKVSALESRLAAEEQKPKIDAGVILIWKGSLAAIPPGWVLCDGANGTPDLRDRFVVGAASDAAGTPRTTISGSPTATGGEATHTLTIDEMPSHHHFGYGENIPNWPLGAKGPNNNQGPSNADMDNYLLGTTDTGGGRAHNILPPYFALAYIMKQ